MWVAQSCMSAKQPHALANSLKAITHESCLLHITHELANSLKAITHESCLLHITHELANSLKVIPINVIVHLIFQQISDCVCQKASGSQRLSQCRSLLR